MPRDIPDGHEELPVVELDDLVEVAPDLRVARGGHVPDGDLHAWPLGGQRRQEAALERQRERVLLGVQPQRVRRQHGRVPELGEQVARVVELVDAHGDRERGAAA
jgi:hypothetical protein